jgi:hypothetical protein
MSDMTDTASATATYPPLTRSEFEDGCAYVYRDIRICEDEDGQYVYAYGHVDPATYALAVNEFDREINGLDDGDDAYVAGDVQHRWAVATQPASAPDGWWIQWGPLDGEPITATTTHAFAVTLISR